MLLLSDSQKIGLGLTVLGAVFLLLGFMFLLDRTFLTIGNILFLAGIGFIIGLSATAKFFLLPRRLRGTIFFLGGVFVVLLGFPIIGIIVEIYGAFRLFGDFLPYVVSYLRQLPVIGPMLSSPAITKLVDRVAGSKFPV